jgi:hypothetical protein
MDIGRVQLPAGTHRLEIVRPNRSLRPGDAQHDVLGPLALVADTPVQLVPGGACGKPADWIDVIRR